jgi:predicted Zn-ribbon and HTH transcriptional regulator
MNLSQVSKQDKLNKIGLSKYESFLPDIAIDKIYEEMILKHKKELILSLLNKILVATNNKEINDILEFKINSIELKKIDAVKFVDDNIEIFEELEMNKNKDLQYNNRFKRKKYILIIIKAIAKYCNYNFESCQSSKKIDNNKVSIIKYKFTDTL